MYELYIKKLFPSKIKNAIKDSLGVPSLRWSLRNLEGCGYRPRFVVDIGAYSGEWTEAFKNVFPDSSILMIEAQQNKRPILEKIKNKFSNVSLHIGLLDSKSDKLAYFIENETASHISVEELPGSVKIKTETLDEIIAKFEFPSPDFIKLDVQGFELEVLKGGSNALKYAEICMLEVTLISLDSFSPLVVESINYLDEYGYQLYDISQFMRRPFDRALYQADFIFVKKDSPLVSQKRWM